MSNSELPVRFFRINNAFEVTCIIWYAAPFSSSEKITLPENMFLRVYERQSSAGDIIYETIPVDSYEWAPFLLSAETRLHPKFRGSYNFFLEPAQLEENCTELDSLPVSPPVPVRKYRALRGCLFGTAVADAIGLPYEGLSSKRISRMKALPLRHRFIFGNGMISDDTEHTCLVAQALINSHGEPGRFARSLAWKLRWWVIGLPAGIGLATLRACIKLCLGFSANSSGVFSAGNGPAMRSAILGVFAGEDSQRLTQLVTINTRITHSDPKAVKGALIVAELAARNAQGQPLTSSNCLESLAPIIADDDELKNAVTAAINSASQNQPALQFCHHMGWIKGVSGYMYHTLPVVIQVVLRHADNFQAAVTEAVSCGGDTDTVAAIVGGIVGAGTGEAGIPEPWLADLSDWPRDKRFIGQLAAELAVMQVLGKPGNVLYIDLIRAWMRNLFFLIWVLGHGLRRIFPPY